MPIIKHNNSHYYDIYYHKYFKYKHKYLTLKNKLQKGSGTPLVNHLKFINRINPDHSAYYELEEHLNLVHGFIWNNTGLIPNYYNFYNITNITKNPNISNDFDLTIGTFINKLYNNVAGIIQPTNNLMNILPDKKLSPSDYGYYLGLNFFLKKHPTILSNISNFINSKKKEYKNNLEELTKYSDFEISFNQFKNKLTSINNILSDYYGNFDTNIFTKNKYDIKFFQICLSTLWWICNDASGITDYYEGLNNVFTDIFNFFNQTLFNSLNMKPDFVKTINDITNFVKEIVIIPDAITPFSIKELKVKEINESTDKWLELSLAISYLEYNGSIKLFHQERAYIFDKKMNYIIDYSDCGETSLRNFINILIFNGNKLDIDILRKYNPSELLLNYYKVFDSIDKQSSTTPLDFLSKKFNARDAWSLVVSNLNNINYLYDTVKDSINYYYEINSRSNKSNTNSNFLSVLQHLFNIDNLDWDSFNDNLKIDANLDKEYLGTIKIKHKKLKTIYKMHFQSIHYFIEAEPSSNVLYNINNKLYTYINNNFDVTNDTFFLKKFIPEKLIDYINSDFITNNIYSLLFNYAYTNYDSDRLKRIKLNILKLKDISYYNLSLWGVKYDNPGNFDINNMIGYTIDDTTDFMKLHTLNIRVPHLTFGQNFNQELKPDDIPNSVTHLTFGYYFNQKLKPGDIPNSVTHLTFGYYFNQKLKPGDIPNSVTHLIFGYKFNQELNTGDIPNSVTYLTFGYYFNQKLKPYVIPSSVTHLTFDNEFNQKLNPDDIPNSVTHLTFGTNFNQELIIYVIPNSVTHLTFGIYFNQLLTPDVIPSSVTHLTFGFDFNQELTPNIIPNSVTNLFFGSGFDRKLKPGDIPNSVTNLTFGTFDQELKIGVIPYHVTHLTFGYNSVFFKNFNQELKPGYIPDSVTHLTFGSHFNQKLKVGDIPNSVTHLTFGNHFNQELKLGDIPSSVTHLTFGNNFNQELKQGDIPNSVTHLTFGYYFNQELKQGDIPNSVTHLTFGNHFNQELKQGVIPSSVTNLTLYSDKLLKTGNIQYIPSNITNLTFGKYFNKKLEPGEISDSITHLTFGYKFNQKLKPGVISDSVTHLTFGEKFNQPLKPDVISNSVIHLTFGENFNQPLKPGVITNSVTHLTFGKKFNQPLNKNNIPNVTRLSISKNYKIPLIKTVLPTGIQLEFNN